MTSKAKNSAPSGLTTLALSASEMARRINKVLEWSCGLCIAGMVLIVWAGAFSRYLADMGYTWTEELARYVMIWGSLLAVPVAAYHREHIGLDLVFKYLPENVKPKMRLALDAVGLAFFLFLTWFGAGMAIKGASQYATIFGMSMALPFAAIPVTSVLTSLMIMISMLRDMAGLGLPQDPNQAELLND